MSSSGPPASGGQELGFPLHEGRHSVLYVIGIQKYPLKDQMNQWTGAKEAAESVSPNEQWTDTIEGEPQGIVW